MPRALIYSKSSSVSFFLMGDENKLTERMQALASLVMLSILLAGLVGCTPASTQPPLRPTPTVPPGWETAAASADQGQCGFVIDHPSAMDFASQGEHSWILRSTATEIPNFIYISIIPDDLRSEGTGIYNYDPGETQTLLNMQIGDSLSLRDDPTLESWFTYTRLPDTMLGDQAARAYENTQPWEFPLGAEEIRYYVQVNNCTYLIGAYIATVGSGQPGAIDEDSFDEIMASFRLAL